MSGENRGEETEATPEPVLLRGTVCVQYIRCSKPRCHCRDGERHGPYYYRVWRESGRVHKAYVRREDVTSVQAACDLYQKLVRDAEKRQRRKPAAAPRAPVTPPPSAAPARRRKVRRCSECGTPAPRHAPDCQWAALIRQLAAMGIEVA